MTSVDVIDDDDNYHRYEEVWVIRLNRLQCQLSGQWQKGKREHEKAHEHNSQAFLLYAVRCTVQCHVFVTLKQIVGLAGFNKI